MWHNVCYMRCLKRILSHFHSKLESEKCAFHILKCYQFSNSAYYLNNETCDYSVSNNFLFTKMQYIALYKFNNVICYMFSFQCNKMKCDPNELAKDWKQYSPAFTNICFSILTKLIIYCSLCHNILRKNRSKKLNHWPSRDSHAVFHHIARYVFQFQNFDRI